MPKLKPATIRVKIEALSIELNELQRERQQMIDGASNPPLIGQYLATKKSGGTAFSGKSERQAAHDYYALVDTAGTFICYVCKHEVSLYRDRITLGKKVAKLDRAIARCNKKIDEYKSKLPVTEQTKSSTDAISDSPPASTANLGNESEVGTPGSNLYTVESDTWIVSEVA